MMKIHQWIFGAICVIQTFTVLVGVGRTISSWYHHEVKKNQDDHVHSIPCSFTSSIILAIEHQQTDWKSFLVNRLVGSKTLPDSFRRKVINQHPSHVSRLSTCYQLSFSCKPRFINVHSSRTYVWK